MGWKKHIEEKSEDTEGSKSKKDKQYNGHKKKDKTIQWPKVKGAIQLLKETRQK